MREVESRRSAVRRWLLIGVAVCAAGAVLWKVPQWQAAAWRAFMTPKDLLLLENDLRQTLALLLGGLALLAVLAIIRRQGAASERAALPALTFMQATQDGQSTERFSRALDLLGHEKLEVRLGAIYALERIARESETDHWPIIEVLCAYVRERAAWYEDRPQPARIPTDIQAILTVLGRRTIAHETRDDHRLDLRRTDLRGADLSDVHLERTVLVEAHFEDTRMQGIQLEGADLRGAHLARADLVEANLRGSDLREANLEAAYLVEAHMEGADLGGAHLEGAYLGGAHLEGADLGGAHLDGAYIYKANLDGATLQGARILTAIGMNRQEREQINRTVADEPAAHRGRRPRPKPSFEPVSEPSGAPADQVAPQRERARG